MIKKLKQNFIDLFTSITILIGSVLALFGSLIGIIYYIFVIPFNLFKTLNAYIVAKTGINYIVRIKLGLYTLNLEHLSRQELQNSIVYFQDKHYGFRTTELSREWMRRYIVECWERSVNGGKH